MAKSREMAGGEIFAHAERHECAFPQPVLRHERSAGAHRCGDISAAELATAEPHRASAVLRAVDRAQQARGTGADQPGDADDLALGEGQVDSLQGSRPHVLDLQQRGADGRVNAGLSA